MTAIREAIVLPAILLTVTLIAGLQVDTRIAFVPPTLFSLILAAILIATLVSSGALAPNALLHGSRALIANANGAVVLGALLLASAQLFTMLTPVTGLPLLLVDMFLFVLLINTLVAKPDRVRLLRSLAVTLGSAMILKFVVLAGLAAPASRTARVLTALFDIATLGTITQAPQPAVTGYLAFFAVALYLTGVALLPHRSAISPPLDLLPARGELKPR